jgi:hypothetical protein
MTNRDVLNFLKAEVAFLESGGYEQGPGAPWRAELIFEDSPNCLNFGLHPRKHPCNECPLIEFVPANRKDETVPCRFIPMNEQGETVDSMYRTATKQERLATVREWLKSTIHQLEAESNAKAS